MELPKFISKYSLSRLLNADIRSKLITNLEPSAIIVNCGKELPLYSFEIVEDLKKKKELN
jgi:hypothetical protein